MSKKQQQIQELKESLLQSLNKAVKLKLNEIAIQIELAIIELEEDYNA